MRHQHLLSLHPDDNVAVLLRDVSGDTTLLLGDCAYTAPEDLRMGHKIAIRRIGGGEAVLKYGAPIGSATCAIEPGEHVHLHNMKSDYRMRHSSREEDANG
jgi:altronate dehydratase small subunit